MKYASSMPNIAPTPISSRWCLLIKILEIHTQTDQHNKGGINIKCTGQLCKKKQTMYEHLEACPEGNENLSGPISNGSFFPGLRLLVIAFNGAIINTSKSKPKK